jgi:hypothetical protein
MQERPPTHLLPKQASQTKPACTPTTEAKQAKEHDDQQDEVGNEHRNEVCCVALRVGEATAAAL